MISNIYFLQGNFQVVKLSLCVISNYSSKKYPSGVLKKEGLTKDEMPKEQSCSD